MINCLRKYCKTTFVSQIVKEHFLLTIPWSQTMAHMNMVENTGLEPVTFWLQTRRSPS